MKVRTYDLLTEKPCADICICALSDTHNRASAALTEKIRSLSPDIILCVGDILERLDGYRDEDNKNGLSFLRELSKIAKVYYSFGNHELYSGSSDRRRYGDTGRIITKENLCAIHSTGVVLLDDEYVLHDGICIGGLSSGLVSQRENIPDLCALDRFADMSGYKILMSHHPEYYEPYIKERDIDLVISGHAHGGQWRLFGAGLYAPQQGVFPKYTKGLHDGRFIVSCGAANSVFPIPRLFNPCEILCINISHAQKSI